MKLSIFKLNESTYQIREGEKSSSMLSRYGVLKGEAAPIDGSDAISVAETNVAFAAKRKVDLSVTRYGDRFTIETKLTADEKFFGLGDSNRDGIMHRGKVITLYKSNVKCYGPMPLLLSNDGWAILVNTTYESVFDIGKTEKNTLEVGAARGR
jgi:hypothetical protein